MGKRCKRGACSGGVGPYFKGYQENRLGNGGKGNGPVEREEMKGLLTDCLALEPQLAMLLLIDDELRMERALKRLDRLSSSEKRFGIPVSLLRYD